MSELVERIAAAIERVTVERQGQGFHLVTGRNDSEAFARAALSVLEARIEQLEREVAEAVAAERERCAKVAEAKFANRGWDAPYRNAGVMLAAAIRNGEREQGWQDIATAPKDGTPILLFARCKTATAPVILVGWHLPNEGWVESSFTGPVGVAPTHWRPLPEPPAIRSGDAG